MTSSKAPEGGESIARLIEDDVEGHRARQSDMDGESIARQSDGGKSIADRGRRRGPPRQPVETEDDVDGRRAKASRPRTTSRATGARGRRVSETEDDVRGPPARRPRRRRGPPRQGVETEDDVEGHRARETEADGESVARETEGDVEGHNIGYGSPTLARDVYRVREREIQREGSRSSLLREAKLVVRRRKG